MSTIQFDCGCSETRDHGDYRSGRGRKCSDCTFDDNYQRGVADTAWADARGLPKLVGSVRQSPWSESIRADTIRTIEAIQVAPDDQAAWEAIRPEVIRTILTQLGNKCGEWIAAGGIYNKDTALQMIANRVGKTERGRVLSEILVQIAKRRTTWTADCYRARLIDMIASAV